MADLKKFAFIPVSMAFSDLGLTRETVLMNDGTTAHCSLYFPLQHVVFQLVPK